MRQLIVVDAMVCLFGSWLAAHGQVSTLSVQVNAEGRPVEKAQIVVGGETRQTDGSGAMQVAVPAGDVEITVVKAGYVATTTGSVLAATGAPYIEALETYRYDVGACGQFLLRDRCVVTARAAIARQSHDHQFGEVSSATTTTPRWRNCDPRHRWPTNMGWGHCR
jgi:hypothetical protein